MEQICTKCKTIKSLENFPKNKKLKNGYHIYCKQCNKNHVAKWRQNNPEKAKLLIEKQSEKWAKQQARWRKENPELHLQNKLKKYHLTLEDYNTFLLIQDNKCKICLISFNDVIKGANIDHCHTTGKVRGLLCHSCNKGLGFFKDNTELLKIAIEYLNK